MLLLPPEETELTQKETTLSRQHVVQTAGSSEGVRQFEHENVTQVLPAPSGDETLVFLPEVRVSYDRVSQPPFLYLIREG